MPADAAPSFVRVDTLPAPGERLVLPPDESHYVARVCRGRAGDRVTATDGEGGLASLRLIEIGPRVSAEVVTREQVSAPRQAWALCGAPEGERGDWLVEKLAELGVQVLQPVDCERARWRHAARRLERWRRIASAALRQSRRCFALEIRPPIDLEQAIASLPADGERWLCDPGGEAAGGLRPAERGLAIGAVGPAEGLAGTERERLTGAGFRAIRLSEGRLRAETAAMAWACWWASGATGGATPAAP